MLPHALSALFRFLSFFCLMRRQTPLICARALLQLIECRYFYAHFPIASDLSDPSYPFPSPSKAQAVFPFACAISACFFHMLSSLLLSCPQKKAQSLFFLCTLVSRIRFYKIVLFLCVHLMKGTPAAAFPPAAYAFLLLSHRLLQSDLLLIYSQGDPVADPERKINNKHADHIYLPEILLHHIRQSMD